MAPKKSSAQKVAEAAARKAAADAAAVNSLSLEEVQALLASKQQAAAAAAKAAADKAAADKAAADKAAAEAAAPTGTGAKPSPGGLDPTLAQLIASTVAAAVATKLEKRFSVTPAETATEDTPAETTAEDTPTHTSAVAKPGLTAEEQAVEQLGGALGQGATAGESFLSKAQREKAAAAKQVREANGKLRLATLIADGAANLGGTGTVDLSAAPAGQGLDFPTNLGASASAGRGTGRGFNFYRPDSGVGRVGGHFSVVGKSCVGSTLSVRSFGRVGAQCSVLQQVQLGSSLSVRTSSRVV